MKPTTSLAIEIFLHDTTLSSGKTCAFDLTESFINLVKELSSTGLSPATHDIFGSCKHSVKPKLLNLAMRGGTIDRLGIYLQQLYFDNCYGVRLSYLNNVFVGYFVDRPPMQNASGRLLNFIARRLCGSFRSWGHMGCLARLLHPTIHETCELLFLYQRHTIPTEDSPCQWIY